MAAQLESKPSTIKLIKDLDELPEGYKVKNTEEGKSVITCLSGVTTTYQNYKTGEAIIRQYDPMDSKNFGTAEVITLGRVYLYADSDNANTIDYSGYINYP